MKNFNAFIAASIAASAHVEAPVVVNVQDPKDAYNRPWQPENLQRQRQQGTQQQQQYSGNVMGYLACASIAGGNPPTITRSRGFSSISRTSAGIYVLTLTNALDIAGGDGIVLVTNNGTTAVGATCQASPTTATTITVTLATLTAVPAAAAADLSFWILVTPIGPN